MYTHIYLLLRREACRYVQEVLPCMQERRRRARPVACKLLTSLLLL